MNALKNLLVIFQNEDVDIGFQNYIATYNRNLYIAFLAPFTTETVGMMAPMPKKEAKWRSYIDTFGTSEFVIIDFINCKDMFFISVHNYVFLHRIVVCNWDYFIGIVHFHLDLLPI